MKVTGFNFQKGRIRLVSMQWEAGAPQFISKKIVDVDPDLPLPELADRYAAHFRGLLDEAAADLIAARQVFESQGLDTSTTQIIPLGILALICHEKGVPLVTYTPPSLRGGKSFGLEKSQKPLETVDSIYGQHPPYWDDVHRGALLVAWRALLDANK